MKRSIEALLVVPMLLVIVAMAILGLCGIARAEPVQQFAFQLTSPNPDDLAVRVLLRRFDTTGGVPPTPTELSMRFPRGVAIDRAFMTPRYLCDGRALRDALDARPTGTPFAVRLAHLDTFARELARSHASRDRAALANVRACERGRLGGGTGSIDARDAIAVLTDPIPVGFSMFLSRGSAPGAVAGFTIIGAADERAPIVRRYPVVAGVHAVVTENLVDDPTPDGVYGLKFVIDTGPINGFQVSIAEVDAHAHTLVLRRGECLRRGHGGRCVRRQRTDASLFQVPACPSSGHYLAQLFAAYEPPLPSETTTIDVPCPRYTGRLRRRAMTTAPRITATAAALAALVVAAAAPAADAPGPRPVVTLSARVSPSRLPIPNGTPMTLRMSTVFRSVPAGGNFVLEQADYRFGRGARLNGALFPSCSAEKLRRAHGRLSVCPRGSKIGYGVGVGRAVSVGITSSGRLTIFNGPGGRSIVLNFVVVRPALVDVTFDVPLRRLHGGRYAFELSTVVPPELRSILDGDIVVQRLDITTGATLTIHGRRRGYFEAATCPRRGSAIHGDFRFNEGASATADLKVVC